MEKTNIFHVIDILEDKAHGGLSKLFGALRTTVTLIWFLITYSEHMNQKMVKRYRIFFWIHDAIITFGLLFGFWCFVLACGEAESCTATAWGEWLLQCLWAFRWLAVGGIILFVLGTANDLWYHGENKEYD